MRISSLVFIAAAFAAALVTAACSGGPSAPSASPAAPAGAAVAYSPEAKQAALDIYATRCAACHGAQGAGDGAAAAALNPKPRNFQSSEWQGAMSDDYLAQIIKVGGAGVGKSALMPPNPDLVNKPDVVAALVAYIRSLKK